MTKKLKKLNDNLNSRNYFCRNQNMKLRKFKALFAHVFVGIFVAKMVISVAPAFSFKFDSDMMNSVILQLEVEHGEKDSPNKGTKLSESKLMCHSLSVLNLSGSKVVLDNSFIEHSKRYVNPYHPSVPTPPPNFS